MQYLCSLVRRKLSYSCETWLERNAEVKHFPERTFFAWQISIEDERTCPYRSSTLGGHYSLGILVQRRDMTATCTNLKVSLQIFKWETPL